MKSISLSVFVFLMAATSASAQNPNRQLDELAEAYFEETLPLSPISATSIGDSRYNHLYVASFAQSTVDRFLALNEKYSARLAAFPRGGLDIKAFHRVVLESGALPLSVLEAKVDRWIAAGGT